MTTTLTGTVERVVFAAPDGPYTVARFRLEGVENQRTYDDLTTIVGNLGTLSEGESLRIGGDWEKHPKHGRHFRVAWFEQKLPSTTLGIQRFLGSGIIKGIGPATAEQIVERFGDQTIAVIEEHPERLREVPKLTHKRADLIVKGWREHHQIRELMLFLQSHNLPIFLAKRLRDQYGDQCVAVLQRDPYQLAQEVYGVGFKTSDAIAVKLGLDPISTSRFVAGIKYVLDEAAREGHVFLPREEVLSRGSILLDVPAEQLEPGLLEAARRDIVVDDEGRIYGSPYFYAERGVANRLQHIQYAPSFIRERLNLHPDAATAAAVAALGVTLAVRQVEAVTMALRDKVSIVTGGPGTGKTMCLHTVITALDQAGLPYSLCAPTGRAAKRMSAATGRQASTIHRLLGYQPADNSFSANEDNPLDPRVVIVDEVSMVDTILFNNLLKAIRDESHVLLVGDSDQLPAVGPGNVLADLLLSETIPHVELNELFRQAHGSEINVAAQQIKQGLIPRPAEGGDLYLISVPDPERAQEVIKELVARRIPDRFRLDAKLDIQVLSPIHRGPAGVSALNRELQALLNGDETVGEVTVGQLRLRRADKVMQIKNNYEKEVFNGDVGLVSGVDSDERVVTVRFGEAGEFRDVDYEFGDLGELVLAYAVSIHKAQGSEFPCVVFPLLTSHYALLQRNLVYTALTRAKQLCVVVHQPKALGMAVQSTRRDRRFTHLGERLKTLRFDPSLEMSMEPL